MCMHYGHDRTQDLAGANTTSQAAEKRQQLSIIDLQQLCHDGVRIPDVTFGRDPCAGHDESPRRCTWKSWHGNIGANMLEALLHTNTWRPGVSMMNVGHNPSAGRGKT